MASLNRFWPTIQTIPAYKIGRHTFLAPKASILFLDFASGDNKLDEFVR